MYRMRGARACSQLSRCRTVALHDDRLQVAVHVERFLAAIGAGCAEADEARHAAHASNVAAADLAARIARHEDAIKAIELAALVQSRLAIRVQRLVTAARQERFVTLWPAGYAHLRPASLASAEHVTGRVSIGPTCPAPLKLKDTACWASQQACVKLEGFDFGLGLLISRRVILSPRTLIRRQPRLCSCRSPIEARRLRKAAAHGLG